MQVIPHEELPRRRPVWDALSAFFLDTELDEPQLREIAAILRASGYSEAELRDILDTELAPLLYPNLCLFVTVAGVWDGFDVAAIEAALLAGKHRHYNRWYGFLGRLAARPIMGYIHRRYWEAVRIFMSEPTPPEIHPSLE